MTGASAKLTSTNTASPSAPDSDNSILVGQITAALAATGRAGLRDLDVVASGGQVVLRGRVNSYFHKQLAQAAALSVTGVGRVKNEVEVR